MNNFGEQRRHERVFFSPDQNVEAKISFLNAIGENHFVAGILDISESGVGLSLDREDIESLQAGDQLFIEEISGDEVLAEISSVTMVVRWVLDHESLRHIGVGCEFVNAPEEVLLQIRAFVTDNA